MEPVTIKDGNLMINLDVLTGQSTRLDRAAEESNAVDTDEAFSGSQFVPGIVTTLEEETDDDDLYMGDDQGTGTPETLSSMTFTDAATLLMSASDMDIKDIKDE